MKSPAAEPKLASLKISYGELGNEMTMSTQQNSNEPIYNNQAVFWRLQILLLPPGVTTHFFPSICSHYIEQYITHM